MSELTFQHQHRFFSTQLIEPRQRWAAENSIEPWNYERDMYSRVISKREDRLRVKLLAEKKRKQSIDERIEEMYRKYKRGNSPTLYAK